MIHHYITKYEERGQRYAESWIQINVETPVEIRDLIKEVTE